MKKNYALCLSFFAVLLYATIFPTQSLASGGCSALYNGGITNQQFCPTPTPTPATKSVAPVLHGYNPPLQTKGGQRIFPSSKTKTTPNTGPEEWSLPFLFLLGGLGFL